MTVGESAPSPNRALTARHLQEVSRRPQHPGSARKQVASRLGGGDSQRLRVDLERSAGDRRPLVGRGTRVTQDHVDLVDVHAELLRHDLRKRSAHTGSEVDMAVQRHDAPVVPD